MSLTRRNLVRCMGGLLLCVIAVAGYYVFMQSQGNFHEVIPGELYRSAQLPPKQLQRYAKDKKIKSIINLRGSNEGQDWYEDEVATAAAMNIKHINYRLSRKNEMTLGQAKELAAILRDAPKPLLIHCKAGIDRTGLATAIYVAAVAKQEDNAALEQFCLHYGFVPLDFLGGYKMLASFNNVKSGLRFL